MSSYPQLNSIQQIKVASPCKMDWNEMEGDNRSRFCQACSLNVYNISEMSQKEALELIQEKEGKLCITLLKRSDGTIITQDCPVGLKLFKKKIKGFCFFAASAILGLVMHFNSDENKKRASFREDFTNCESEAYDDSSDERLIGKTGVIEGV